MDLEDVDLIWYSSSISQYCVLISTVSGMGFILMLSVSYWIPLILSGGCVSGGGRGVGRTSGEGEGCGTGSTRLSVARAGGIILIDREALPLFRALTGSKSPGGP